MRRHAHRDDPEEIQVPRPCDPSFHPLLKHDPARDQTPDQSADCEHGGDEAVSRSCEADTQREAGRGREGGRETRERGDGEVELGEVIAVWKCRLVSSIGQCE